MNKNNLGYLGTFISFLLLGISGADMMGRRVFTNHLEIGWSAWTFWIGIIILLIALYLLFDDKDNISFK